MHKTPPVMTAACMLLALVAAPPTHADPSGAYFGLHLQRGETITDIFSKTISIKGNGFQEVALRISGSATYSTLDPSPSAPVFREQYRYDGRGGGDETITLRDDGQSYCTDGKCSVDSDSSGVAFNPLLWGAPPQSVKSGTSWQVTVRQPWELGPPGRETVRVASLDPVNHVVMLDRTGTGTGESNEEDAHSTHISVGGKSVQVQIVPGRSHWRGRTVFQSGIILSDVILIERPVTLISKQGTFHGVEREYTLLNALPMAG